MAWGEAHEPTSVPEDRLPGVLAELDQVRATIADYRSLAVEQAAVVEAVTGELLGTRELLRDALDLLSESDDAVTALDGADVWSRYQKAMGSLLEVRNRARAWRADVFDAAVGGTNEEVAEHG